MRKNNMNHLRHERFLKSVYKLRKTISRAIHKRISLKVNRCLRNIKNMVKYGWSAPRVGEIILVNPRNCTMALLSFKDLCGASKASDSSGIVIESSWPVKQAIPIFDVDKFMRCREHWIYGVPWEKTGIFKHIEKKINDKGKHDGCKNKTDIIKRYENLDKIFEQIKREGKLQKSVDLPIVHIGPYGILFWGRGPGQHRTAIAHILGIPYLAQIGCVHVSAISYLVQYRKGLKR